MSITNAIILLMAFIIILSIWAWIDRDKPMKKRDEELDEVRRLQAEEDDD